MATMVKEVMRVSVNGWNVDDVDKWEHSISALCKTFEVKSVELEDDLTEQGDDIVARFLNATADSFKVHGRWRVISEHLNRKGNLVIRFARCVVIPDENKQINFIKWVKGED